MSASEVVSGPIAFRRSPVDAFESITERAFGVYAGTKNAVRTISEALRQEAGDTLRVTGVSPGFIHTNFADSMTDPQMKASTIEKMAQIAIPPDAIARGIAFAIEQPADVDVGEIVIRPTAQD